MYEQLNMILKHCQCETRGSQIVGIEQDSINQNENQEKRDVLTFVKAEFRFRPYLRLGITLLDRSLICVDRLNSCTDNNEDKTFNIRLFCL